MNRKLHEQIRKHSSTLVKSLVDYRFERDLGTKQDNAYGFENPKVKVSLGYPNGSFSFIVGNKSPVGFSSYLKVDGSPDSLLGNHAIYTALNKDFDDMRSKTIGVPRSKD